MSSLPCKFKNWSDASNWVANDQLETKIDALSKYSVASDVTTALALKADSADIPSIVGLQSASDVSSAINTALADYTTTTNLNAALSAKLATTDLETEAISVGFAKTADVVTLAGCDTVVSNLGYAKSVDVPSIDGLATESNVFRKDNLNLQNLFKVLQASLNLTELDGTTPFSWDSLIIS